MTEQQKPEQDGRPDPGFQSHVALNIINKCSSRCVFCFEGDRSTLTTPSLEEVFAVLEKTATQVNLVVFMGGEALLRPDIVEILDRSRELGLSISLFTNGLALAKRDLLTRCAEAGLQTLHISVNAWDRDSWSRISGLPKTRYDRFLQALTNLRAHFLEDPVTLGWANFHVLPFAWNAEHLDDIVALVLDQVFHVGPDHSGSVPLRIRPELTFKVCHNVEGCRLSRDELVPDMTVLRDSFVRVVQRYGDVADLHFWGISMCLLPGIEHLSNQLEQYIQGVSIYSNFEDQSNVGPMQDFDWSIIPAAFRERCGSCTLAPLCPGPCDAYSWQDTPPERHMPFPSTTDPVAILTRMGVSAEAASRMVEQRRLEVQAAMARGGNPVPGTAGEVQRPDTASPLCRSMQFGVSWLLQNAAGVAKGCRLVRARDFRDQDRTSVHLEFHDPSGADFRVIVEDRLPGEDYPAQTSRHGLRFRKDAPANTPVRLRLMQLVLRCLADVEKRAEPETT